MVRKLKYHEQKLLKKVDFTTWKSDKDHREHEVIRRYYIQKRDDYEKYNKLVGSITKLAHRLARLPPDSAFRKKHEDFLLSKLNDIGVLKKTVAVGKLSDVDALTVSAFCRRRLPVVMTRLRMAQTVEQATKIIEQGHVRVGTETITDTAYLVTRSMEDFVTWVDGSKIKRHILKYKSQLDDFDLL